MKKIRIDFLQDYIPIIEEEKMWSYILFFTVVFTYKVSMFLISIPFIVFMIKMKKENKRKFPYIFGYYSIVRILFSMVVENRSIQAQGLRMLFLVWILTIIFSGKNIKSLILDLKEILIKEKIIKYIFVIVFWGTLWNFLSPGGKASGFGYFNNIQIWLLCFLAMPYMKEKRKIEKLLWLVMVFSTLLNFYEILNLYANRNFHQVLSNGRVNSITVGISIFSYFFLKILLPNKLGIKMISIIGCLMWIVMILLSGGRGSALAILFSVIFSIILICKKKALIYIPILISLCMLLLHSDLDLAKRFRHLSNMDMKNNTSYARIALVKAGIYTFKKNVVFGSGFGNTQEYFIQYRDIKLSDVTEKGLLYGMNQRELENFPDSHNIIIDYLASTGLFGVVLSIFFIFFIPTISLKDFIRRNFQEGLYCFMVFMTFNVGGMTWSTLMQHTKGTSFLVIMLLLLVYKRGEKSEFIES